MQGFSKWHQSWANVVKKIQVKGKQRLERTELFICYLNEIRPIWKRYSLKILMPNLEHEGTKGKALRYFYLQARTPILLYQN